MFIVVNILYIENHKMKRKLQNHVFIFFSARNSFVHLVAGFIYII